MRPLRIKASGSPLSAANFRGLQEMADIEINQYLSYIITKRFASDTNGTGTAELNVSTNNGAFSGTSIGNFVDTERTEAVGTHPATGTTTTAATYYFKQVTAAASENITNRPLGWETSGTVGINEFDDTQLVTDILDKVIEDMVTETAYTVGQYKLSVSPPAGGTWISRYTITNTTQGGNNNIYLWQKTAPTSAANSNLAPLKIFNTSDIKMMSVAEIEQMVPYFRNRIIASGVGTYKLQLTTPVEAGTWIIAGDAGGFNDTRQQVSPVSYSTIFSRSFTGTYSGSYQANYTGIYANNFSASYIGPKTYTGAYTTAFSGTYVLYYAGFVGGNFTGAYSQSFTGNYVGTSVYTGIYSNNFTGVFSRLFSGNYSGNYTGIYTTNYTGNTVSASTELVSNVKLWIRTA